MADTAGQLAKLKSLLELGALSQAEHDQRRQAILDVEFGVSTSPTGGTPGKKGTDDGFRSSMVIGPADRPYQLEEKLGEGGMGQVWRAQDMAESETVGKPVWKAVKILPLTPDTDPTQYKWLKQEAMLAARLSHPNIVRVFDWREDHTTGLPFIVMEWLQGMDLGKVLAKEGNPGLPFERVIELLTPVVEALDYAWAEHSLVHRDIKPGNIFLTQEGRIKLLDFGIAARGRKTSSLLNFEGREQAGTEGYRAPEARAKQKPHPKLDVYALGVLVYELLEGDTPFEGERSPYTPLPDKPGALNEAQWLVLQQAFAFEVSQRPETTVEFWQTIHRAAGPTVEELERQRQEQVAQKQVEAAKGEAAAEVNQLKDELERRKVEENIQEEKRSRDEVRWRLAFQKNSSMGYQEYLDQAETLLYREEAQIRLEKCLEGQDILCWQMQQMLIRYDGKLSDAQRKFKLSEKAKQNPKYLSARRHLERLGYKIQD